MYFVFTPEPRYWIDQSGTDHAAAIPLNYGSHQQLGAQLGYPLVPNTDLHWRTASPLPIQFPRTVFGINTAEPLLDNIDTCSIFDLYSERLISLLHSIGIRFETFPADLVDYHSYAPVLASYTVFHLLEKYPALDAERSQAEGRRHGYRRLALTDTCLQAQYPLFRAAERPSLIFIHRDLKAMLEANAITGCQYEPAESRLW